MNDWTAQSDHEARVKLGRLALKAGSWSVRMKGGRTIRLDDWRVPDGARDDDRVEVTTSNDGEDVFAVRAIGV